MPYDRFDTPALIRSRGLAFDPIPRYRSDPEAFGIDLFWDTDLIQYPYVWFDTPALI
jgi:hypothetical protein